MSDLLVKDASLIAVADALRTAGGTDEALVFPDGFVQAAEELKTVYDTGYDAGYTDGETTGYTKGQEEGFEQGKKSEYDTFWDAFQYNGERTVYRNGINGKYWNMNNFRPKYDIVETDGRSTFENFNAENPAFDFAKHLEDCGVQLDMSKSRYFSYTFAGMNVTRLPVIECLASSPSLHTFYLMTALETIDKLVLRDDATLGTNVFTKCTALKNIVFEGTINGVTNCGISSCPLTPASAKSLINALKNHSGTDQEFVYSLSLSSAVWEALEADSTAPTGTTWKEYVNSLGWNT